MLDDGPTRPRDLVDQGRTVNRFRGRRGKRLAQMIRTISHRLGRPLNILDVGGRANYWANVGYDGIGHVSVMNYEPGELDRPPAEDAPANLFSYVQGDARDLRDYGDGSVDLVHSNSVIEHVGLWPDMVAMANEVRRVGAAGWIQTPAWEFPLEPHFRVPFIHWFGEPLRRQMLRLSPRYGHHSADTRRRHVDRINLLSRSEVSLLFPDCEIEVERIVIPKSYVVRWGEAV